MASQKAENLAVFGNRLIALSEENRGIVNGLDSDSPDAITSLDVERLLEGLGHKLEAVAEMLEIALSIEGELGVEVYALLSILYRNYSAGADWAEYVGTGDKDAFGMIAYAYRISHRVTYPAVEILGAKLVAKSQFEEKNRYGVPLRPRAQSVYEIILSHGPIMGKNVIEKLDEASPVGQSSLEQATLTKDVIPDLKKYRGIKNKGGRGYYDPQSYDAKKDSRK